MQTAHSRKEPCHQNRHWKLTKAEEATLQLLQQGMALDDIAKTLNVNRETIRCRVKTIKEKMS